MASSVTGGRPRRFDGLVQRFEAPDSRNRWDSPLFTLHWDEELPLEAVWEALRGRKAPPPNLATQCVRVPPPTGKGRSF